MFNEFETAQFIQLFNASMAPGLYYLIEGRIVQICMELFSKRHVTFKLLIDGNYMQACPFRANMKPKLGPGQQFPSPGEVH